jgi:hypothetical protein
MLVLGDATTDDDDDDNGVFFGVINVLVLLSGTLGDTTAGCLIDTLSSSLSLSLSFFSVLLLALALALA